MFSHVTLGSDDLERSKRFYDATLAIMGVPPAEIMDHPITKRLVYFHPDGQFLTILKPIDLAPTSVGNGSTIGFAIDDPAKIDAWHAAGVAAGGTSVEDPPGYRERPIGRLYLAYLRDPDGNKLCAFLKLPPAA